MRAAFFVVLLSGVALAQTGDPSPQSANAHGTNARQLTVRGCVTGDQRYSLTQAGTGTGFSLEGDPVKLASAKGKLAEVTGREMPPDASTGPLPRLMVNDVKIVEQECPPGAPASRRSASTTAAPPPTASAPSPYSGVGAPDQTPPTVNNPNISGATGAPSPGTGNPPPTPPE